MSKPSWLPHHALLETAADGSIILRSGHALGPVARNTGEWLHRWAREAPERVFLGERSGAGWREVSYAAALDQVRALAAGLLARGLNADRPLVVISGNGVDHGLLALACQYVGIPIVPMAEQYALIPQAHERMLWIIDRVQPGAIFVDDAERYGAAVARLAGHQVIAARPTAGLIALDELTRASMAGLDAVHATVGPDTVAKILFTSGSTANPKGVLTTNRMMCTNQAQLAAVWPFLHHRPPRILDWLPWNHVFGGSHNFNMMLANGGSLFIDDGKPTKALFEATLRNLAERPGTMAFNVPVGYAMLAEALRNDPALARLFFADLDLVFYAGASLPAPIWAALEEGARAVRGAPPLMTSSWGMTETAPAVLAVHQPITRTGVIGVPLPQAEVKLLPLGDGRYELRCRGPNVMTGYYKDPAKTAESFDAEGWLITGDAVRFVDPADVNAGLAFDGRVSEDFKLNTGTWVRASMLRLELLAHLAGVAQDLVICGQDQAEVGLILFPLPDAPLGTVDGLARSGPELRARLATMLAAMQAKASGSANRIARVIMAAEPLSLAEGELTAKGSVNIRKVLDRRAALVARLYDNDDPAVVRGE